MGAAPGKRNKSSFGGSCIRFSMIGLGGMLLLACLGACTSGKLVDEFTKIPDRSWTYDFKPEVNLHVPDKSKPYKVFVNLRHTHQYQYSNIFLLVHQQGSAGAVQTKRIELQLALSDGRWTGKSSGNLYTHQYLLSEHHYFPDTGVFRLSLEQNMRDNPLQHVVESGFRVDQVE